MAEADPTITTAPWAGAVDAAPGAVPKTFPWATFLPVVGPLALFILWDLVVRFGFIKAILLPSPLDTLNALVGGLAGGPLLLDFAVTVKRTLEAFAIAAVIGVPLGVLLGSNERAYRSVEFLIDFFRSTPSSALIFKDVLIWESLQPTFVGLRSAVSMALVIVIVAEMFIGSDTGLGHRIIDAQQVLNVKSMYAAILAAGILGYTLNVLFLVIERRVVHWSGR
jgi:ABC-type nitrate/sulfonate/bicarbonate transport system permease component